MPNREHSSTRVWPAMMAALVLVCIAGCAKPAGVIFEPLPKPLVWPAPPELPRISYVGQLVTEADLKPAISFAQSMGMALFGKDPVRSMLTPFALCTDGADRLFVADSNAQLVHVFDLNTRRYEQWIPSNAEKRFSQPVGIAYDPAGRLLVADSVAGRIFVFDATTGKQTGELGIDFLQRPCGLAIDSARNRIFIADAGSHQVVVLSPSGSLLGRIGQRGVEAGQFNYPTNVVLDRQGNLFVSDSLNFRIQVFGADLQHQRTIGAKGDMPGYFSQPKGLAMDGEDHLYVLDAHFENVQIFSSQGEFLLDFGQEGQRPGEFWLPTSIFIDAKNRIWIADSYNRRIQVFDYLLEKR